MKARVVVVSDCTDLAFAEMRSAIYRAAAEYAPDAEVRIEPLVPVSNFSVINTGFALRMLAETALPGTILMFIMNSLAERTERIVGRTARGDLVFEGTNTGAVGWLLEDFGIAECHELTDPGFVPFGGKFVHAPAVGQLAAGRPMSELGLPFDHSRVRRTLPMEGEIVHVDNFGNAKFQAREAGFQQGERVVLQVGGRVVEATVCRRMMESAEGTWTVYPGSSLDLMELGQVRGRGLLDFGVGPGDTIKLEARVHGEDQ